MISPKKLLKMARKWQKAASITRKRISLPGGNAFLRATGTSSVADKGHFVVYTTDKKRFVFPLSYLNTSIFRELFQLSEEEFGLQSDGPITFPCNAVFMENVISIIRDHSRKPKKKVLLPSISMGKCLSSYQQLESSRQPLIYGF